MRMTNLRSSQYVNSIIIRLFKKIKLLIKVFNKMT